MQLPLSTLSLLLVAGLISVGNAEVSDECLACMCFASSSGCEMPDPACTRHDWGEVCGPWGITFYYWVDGGALGGSFYNCGGSWQCSEDTVKGYLNKYVYDPHATCERYARTHAGGPSGFDQDSTLNYWYMVKTCLDYGLVTPPTDDE